MKTAALLVLILVQLHTQGQSLSGSAINTSGNSYTKSNYNLEWSIGELALVETMCSSDGRLVVSNGLLQPDMPRANILRSFTPDELKILPNPTYDKVEINLSTRQTGVLTILVFDAQGKLVTSAKKTMYGVPVVERIDLSMYGSGTYLLKLELGTTDGVRKTGTHKIVKI